jgi:uncharacterized phage infection (PIP) family protein YhgE
MLFFKKKVISLEQKVAQVIKEHDDQLEKLGKEAEDALDSFKRTVNRLEMINGKIDDSVSLMEQQIKHLNDVKNNMLSNKERNSKIKDKIQEFLA